MVIKNTNGAGDSTTPAENTKQNSLRALVDWVTCSFQLDVTPSELFHFLGVLNLSEMEEVYGARYEFAGYDVTYQLGAIELMLDQKKNKWLLNMSGQACRQFEISSSYDFVMLFGLLSNVNATYTRLDIAIDDFKGIYSVNTIRNAVYNKQCVTRLTEWGNGERGKIATGKDEMTMDNFYLGHSKSRYLLNVYDKKMERIARKKDLEKDENGKEVETWTRTEVRFKYEYAEQFVDHIINDHNNLGYHLKSFLNAKIQFLTKTALLKDNNKSRLCKDTQNICKWWRTFLNGAGKLNLTVYKPDKTLLESKDWLYNQVSTTLAMLHLYKPDEFGELVQDLTKDGIEKMKKKHQKKIDNQIYLDEHMIEYDLGWRSAQGKLKKEKNTIEELTATYWGQVKEQQKNLTPEQELDFVKN